MTTVLWLGAHKTGTTFLQKCLDLSAEQLRDHGIHYTELGEFRQRYTRPLLQEGASEPPAAPGEFADPDRPVTLVFDENIAGLVQHAVSRDGFYPVAGQRARTITEYLDLRVDTVVLGVRRYDAFLPSMYCETLKSTKFRPFDDYLRRALAPADPHYRSADASNDGSRLVFSRLNWYLLTRRLGAAFPGAGVRVYFHEDLRGREAILLQEVLGLPASDITLLESTERAGFSGRAVDELHALAQQREVQRRDVSEVTSAYPSGAEYPTFYPWSEADSELLAELYRTHTLEILADRMIDTIPLE